MDFMAQRSATHLNFWPYELFDLDSGTRSYLQSFDPNVDDDPYDFRTGFDTPGFISKGSSTESLKTDWTIGDLGPIHDLHAVLIGGYSRSEEHTSELQSLMRTSYAVFCLNKKTKIQSTTKLS